MSAYPVVQLEAAHLDAVVALHLSALERDFISSLGPRFLRDVFYSYTLSSPGGAGFVALGASGQVVGFVTGCLESSSFYRSMLRGRPLRSGAALLRRLTASPVKTLSVVGRVRDGSPPPHRAELSYIAVDTSHRRKGVAGALISALLAHYRSAGESGCWTKTRAALAGARHMYERSGMTLHHEFELNGEKNVVYAIDFRGLGSPRSTT